MYLNILIPKKADVVGNISTTKLNLIHYKDTVNPENNLDSYWLQGEFENLSNIAEYAKKLKSKITLLSKLVLRFPEYYQASIVLNSTIKTKPYKAIVNDNYVVIKKQDSSLVLTIKQPTLEELFDKLIDIENLI